MQYMCCSTFYSPRLNARRHRVHIPEDVPEDTCSVEHNSQGVVPFPNCHHAWMTAKIESRMRSQSPSEVDAKLRKTLNLRRRRASVRKKNEATPNTKVNSDGNQRRLRIQRIVGDRRLVGIAAAALIEWPVDAGGLWLQSLQ